MASTNSGTKTKAVKTVVTSISKQVVRQILKDLLTSKFSATLGKEVDVENVCMALLYRESGFRSDAKGPAYGPSHVKTILRYPKIKNTYDTGSADDRQNIVNSAAAFGMGQVTGYYVIRGATASGKGELERLRPDLAGPIMVEPGMDVRTTLIGDDTIKNQITAMLIVLEGKYKEVAPRLVANGRYSNRLTASVAAYLGLGASDSLGTTPEAYANSIIRGEAYAKANDVKGADGRPLVAGYGAVTSNGSSAKPSGPPKTVASGNVLSIAGC